MYEKQFSSSMVDIYITSSEDFFSACCVPGRDATMGSLINSNFRVRPSSKFAHTVDRVKEYHNYIGYLALSILRVLLIGGKYYKIHIAALPDIPLSIAPTQALCLP